MKRAAPLLFCLLLLLLSCGEQRYSAQKCQSLEVTFVQRCVGGNLESGKYVGDLKCWPFSKPHRMHGVWFRNFEDSYFHPNSTHLKGTPSDTWLVTTLPIPPSLDGAFLVDFLGQESMCDGNYGRTGAASHEVVAVRFYSLRKLPIQ